MRIYKRVYTDRAGKRRKSSKWYVEFWDARTASQARVPLVADKAASTEIARKLVKIAAFRSADETASLPLRRTIESMPRHVRRAIERLHLVDSDSVQGHRPLKEHLEDFRKSMKAERRAPRHISWTISQIQRVVEGCKFHYWADVSAERIKQQLRRLAGDGDGVEDKEVAREDTTGKPATEKAPAKGLRTRSYNGYVTAFKSFANWAVKDGRLRESPLATLGKLKITDAKERRALTMDEARLLLAITEQSVERFGMTGPDRALVYRLALETGLRAGELHSLTRASFELATGEPVVVVAARSTKKNRKVARIHLSAETGAALSVHLENKLPAASAFNLPDSTHTAEMLRADLAEGRAAWVKAAPEGPQRIEREGGEFLVEKDHAGRELVFHSLRHTRGVWLFEHFGASPREVQELMRVSSIAMVDRYAKSFRVGGRNFAARNPGLSADLSPVVAAALPKVKRAVAKSAS